jgi:CMP-N-acetylneuraminic acid synthetase
MSLVAFVFARGGSKGLPGKNIRALGGKPLIAWSIEQALGVPRIERVIVSTDSEEIARISKHYGAEVPFLRPSELAGDESPEWLAWRHGLEYLEKTTGSLPDFLVSLPATSPLRFGIDIENCINEMEKGVADSVITVTSSHRNPYFNMVKINSDGTCDLVNASKSHASRRQDAPKVYDMTTVCYVVKSEFIMSHDSIFEGTVLPVFVPIERSIDIDSMFDFQMAEVLISNRGKKIV